MSAAEFAGTLRERVTVQRRAGDRDPLGEAVGAWATLAPVRAAIAPDDPGPIEEADALAALPGWRVIMRPTDVAVGDRLGWGARLLRVDAVTADPRTPDRILLAVRELRP